MRNQRARIRAATYSIILVLCLLPVPGVQAGAEDNSYIEGHVFRDDNGDGQWQPEEPGVGGVTVEITPQPPAQPTPIAAVTDLLGYYLVEDLRPGAYYLVEALPPSGYVCVSCQATVQLGTGPQPAVNLGLQLIVPHTPTPTPTPTATSAPTFTPTLTFTPPPTNTPPPTRTPAPTPTPGNLVITFYASPDTTRFPGDCSTLYWWVANATEVFLLLPGGQVGVEGSGQHQICPEDTTTYRLKVNGQNGTQEIVEARVSVPPAPTNTPVPPPRPKPTRQTPPTATPTPIITATATLTPTLTPTPTWTPLPTSTPTVDPLLAGLPLRWGTVTWLATGGLDENE